MSKFNEMPLNKALIRAIEELGYATPTPIQNEAIPIALSGGDVIASAQTGTGKTAAFLLPAIQAITEGKGPQVLVLVPTRELAEQVAKEAVRFSKYMPHIKTVCVYGGVPYHAQMRALSKPYQILIATPGRLIDHIERGKINLSNIKYFVLDEADRMLDMGFVDPVLSISELTPESKQTMLFSATINKGIQKISQRLQNDPYKIEIQADQKQHELIEQRLYYADNYNHKLKLLETLLADEEINQAIVFTATKMGAEKLAYGLKDQGFDTAALHGDIPQKKRNMTLGRLRNGTVKFLVATDVAARGIDVSTITHVINFDLPQVPEDYVHRIGRTGRAGSSGVAITFAAYGEAKFLSIVQKLTGKEMNILTIAGLEPTQKQKRPGSDAPFRKKRGAFAPKRGGFAPKGEKKPFFRGGQRNRQPAKRFAD